MESAAGDVEHDDYDSPWKEAIQDSFEAFMAFFFQAAHAEIDWTRAPEFLDKELQQITRDAELGRGVADILVKVSLKSGEERWLVVHVEVQGQRLALFTERMYVYNFRAYDQHRERIASLAILTDESTAPFANTFGYEAFGCEIYFKFPIARLADFRTRRAELTQSQNPFAIFVLAHLDTQDTRGDNEKRFISLRRLLHLIRERGFSEDVFHRMYRLINWLLNLPDTFDTCIVKEVQSIEEGYSMRYQSAVERVAARDALRGAILDFLQELDPVSVTLRERIMVLSDESKLRALLKIAPYVKSLAEFEAKLDILN